MAKQLSLDDLSGISGGRIKLAGYGLLTAMIAQIKMLGKDKEECIQVLKDGWETDCEFKKLFTDQTGEDLQAAIDFINNVW